MEENFNNEEERNQTPEGVNAAGDGAQVQTSEQRDGMYRNPSEQTQGQGDGMYGNPQYGSYGYGQPGSGSPQYGSYGYGQPYSAPADSKSDSIGFGVASLVLGIVSILLFCTCISWITAILAIIFGIIQLVKCRQKGLAIGGLITAGLGLLFSIILYASIFVSGSGSYNTYYHMYDDIYDDIYNDIYDDMYYEFDDGTI